MNVNEFERAGHVWMEGDALAPCLQRILSEADKFFALPHAAKTNLQQDKVMTGYRSKGVEYANTPDRPDLMETFSLRPGDAEACARLAGDPASAELYAACAAYLELTHALVDQALTEITRHLYGVDTQWAVKKASWVQINRYCPHGESRDILQDMHEDGHLLTLLFADQPGLEIQEPDTKNIRPIDTTGSRLLLMSGSLLTEFSEGRIPPLYHQVRRHAQVAQRYSVVYFVNPDPINPDPFLAARMKALAEKGLTNNAQFGLPV